MEVDKYAHEKGLLFFSLLLLILCTCSQTVDIRIPEKEISDDLQQKFPESQTYGGIAQVTLQNPSLMLGRSKNRLTFGIDAVITPRELGIIEISSGRVVFSSDLDFDNRTGRFFFSNVEVDSIIIDLNTLDSQIQQGIREVIRELLRSNLENSTFYILEPSDVRTSIAKLFIRNVTIEDDGILVTMSYN
jgi:hypothetical protein